MASLLDTTTWGSLLAPLIVFLLVLAISFAVLKKSKFFGENEGLNALISFIVAIFTVMVPESSTVLGNFIPWFVMFLILAAFIFMFFIFMGVKQDDITKNVLKSPVFITVAIGAVFIMFLVAMTQAFGPFLAVTGGDGFWDVTKRLLFNKRTLGILFMIVVAGYAVLYIGTPNKKK